MVSKYALLHFLERCGVSEENIYFVYRWAGKFENEDWFCDWVILFGYSDVADLLEMINHLPSPPIFTDPPPKPPVHRTNEFYVNGRYFRRS